MSRSWCIVSVNMDPADVEALDRLAALWGTSRAATVRRLIRAAAPSDGGDRNGHTCPEGVLARYGTSNPMASGGPCPACWSTPPTVLERQDAERTVALQACLPVTPGEVRVPWWVHLAERRRLMADEEAEE